MADSTPPCLRLVTCTSYLVYRDAVTESRNSVPNTHIFHLLQIHRTKEITAAFRANRNPIPRRGYSILALCIRSSSAEHWKDFPLERG
jgi:hypothetical protein